MSVAQPPSVPDTAKEVAELRIGEQVLELPIERAAAGPAGDQHQRPAEGRPRDDPRLRLRQHRARRGAPSPSSTATPASCATAATRSSSSPSGRPSSRRPTCSSTASCRRPSSWRTGPTQITRHTLLHEEFKRFFDGFPMDAHPMGILASAVAALSTFYQDSQDPLDAEDVEISTVRLIAKMPTIAAFAHKKSIGQPFIYPDNTLDYESNFLQMMFAVPTRAVRRRSRRRAARCASCSSSTPTTSRTARPRPSGWSARATPTCTPRSRPASPPCGARSTAAPTRKSSRCSRRSTPTAATSPSSSTGPRTRTTRSG